jgi:hypothetical protein
MNTYHYKPAVLEELKRHGILPQPTTDPALIREFLNDLYVYEIRKLKQQQVALEGEHGRQARKGYADKVVALRLKYPLLSVPLQNWLESEPRIDAN